jgi:fumarate hydratase, class II
VTQHQAAEALAINRSLMLVTALAPVIGYAKASKIVHHVLANDLTLRGEQVLVGLPTPTA